MVIALFFRKIIFGVADYSAGDTFARVPCFEAFLILAVATIVFVFMNNQAPPDNVAFIAAQLYFVVVVVVFSFALFVGVQIA